MREKIKKKMHGAGDDVRCILSIIIGMSVTFNSARLGESLN